MALLNPPDILPEAMRYILRAIIADPAREAEEVDVLGLVAPDGLAEAMASIGTAASIEGDDGEDLKTGGKVIAKESLKALRSLRFVESRGTRVVVVDAASRWKKPAEVTAPEFATAMRRTVFQGALASDNAVGSDLVAACSMLAAAPEPLKPFTSFDKPSATRRFNELESQQADSAWTTANLNQERWMSFRRISPYLGLTRPVGGSGVSSGLIADSSRALSEELLDLPPGRYEVIDFVARCAKAIPFLDGGPFDQFGAASTQDGNNSLSPGLSVSIRQLEAVGLIRIPAPESDTETRTLSLVRDPSANKSISHLEWIGVSTKRATK